MLIDEVRKHQPPEAEEKSAMAAALPSRIAAGILTA
jgi:hypothetical protein